MKKILIASVLAGIFLIASGGADPVVCRMRLEVKDSEIINKEGVNFTDVDHQVVIYLTKIKESSKYIIRNNTEETTQNNIPIKPEYDIPLLLPEYQDYIWLRCYQEMISYESFISLIYVENNSFDVTAVSPDRHDKGLVQARDYYYEWHCELVGRKIDYFNPYDSIDLGVALYKFYMGIWEGKVLNEELLYYTVNSYNMGETGFNKFLSKYGKMDRKYSSDILKWKNNLEQYGTF